MDVTSETSKHNNSYTPVTVRPNRASEVTSMLPNDVNIEAVLESIRSGNKHDVVKFSDLIQPLVQAQVRAEMTRIQVSYDEDACHASNNRHPAKDSSSKSNNTFTLDDFSQSTTFHGVRYFIHSRSSCHRRLLWLLAWLASVALLAMLVNAKVRYLKSYPSTVDIWDDHVTSLPFPAVTVCHRNQYRLSRSHELGVYDALQMTDRTSTADYSGYVYNASTCTIPPNAFFSQTIASTSIAVCERLCNNTHLYSTYCSGFFWLRTDKSCILTSYTGQSEISDCSLTNSDDLVMFFRRLRPWRQQPLYCTFDEEPGKAQEACPLVQEQTLTFPHQWLRVAHGEEIASADISTGSKHGRAFILSVPSTSFQTRPLARFITPLMNTTGKCLLLFRARYFNKGTQGQLKLSVVDEEFAEVASATRDIVHNVVNSYSPLRYEPYFAHLPPGLNMVMFTATGHGNVRIFIDDLSVRPCQDFYSRECLLSAKGNEYMGSLDINNSNERCQSRGSFNVSQARLTDHGDYRQIANLCRYSEQVDEVACAGSNATLNKCSINHCPCAEGWFACRSGPCLPLRMFCDGLDDCPEGDQSDEDSKHCQQANQWHGIITSSGATLDGVSLPINMVTEPSLIRPDENKLLYDENDIMSVPGTNKRNTVWDKLIKAADMNATTFVASLGHVMNSSLLGCRWQKRTGCAELKPHLRFTDMGQCYAFNADTTATIETKAVGEQSGGLLMIINTESYESITNGRSGVKILPFDANKDIELMSDHGINLSPGFYTTLAMTVNRVEYLEPPYGKCGSIALNYTLGNYSYSNCLRDKELSDFVAQCKCRKILTPGPSSEQCSVRQLLTCSRNHSLINSVVCPSHCDGINYETKLSLSAMSVVDFTENFKSDQLHHIQKRFATVRDLHSRLTFGTLETFLEILMRISTLTKYVRTAMESTLPAFAEHIHKRLANFRSKLVAIVDAMHDDVTQDLYNNERFGAMYESLMQALSLCNMQLDILRHNGNMSFLPMQVAFICTIKPAIDAVNLGYEAAERILLLTNQTMNICQPLQKDGTLCFSSLSNIAKTLMNVNITLTNLAEHFKFHASRDYLALCTKRDQRTAVEEEDLADSANLITDLYRAVNQFILFHSAISECYERHARLVNDISSFSVASSGSRDYRNDIALADKALDELNRVYSVFDNIRTGVLLNKLSLQSAGYIIKANVEDVKSSLEWMRNFIYNRLLITWPDSLQEERNELVDAVYRLLQLLRSVNINCNTKGNYRLHEFFGKLVSARHAYHITKNNKYTIDDVILALSDSSDLTGADIVMLPGGDTTSVKTIAQHCRVGRDEVTWRADMVAQYDEWEARLVSLKGELDDVQNHVETYNRSLTINDDFVRKNIVVARLFLSEMRVKRTQQNIAYDWFSFLSDFGGSLGLLLGTSVLSFMELLDFAVFRAAACLTRR